MSVSWDDIPPEVRYRIMCEANKLYLEEVREVERRVFVAHVQRAHHIFMAYFGMDDLLTHMATGKGLSKDVILERCWSHARHALLPLRSYGNDVWHQALFEIHPRLYEAVLWREKLDELMMND